MGKVVLVLFNTFVASPVIFLFMMGFLFGCTNEMVVVQAPVEVFEKPFPKQYAGTTNQVIETLQKGQEVRVLGSEYGKDFLAYKVRLADGRVGYLIAGDEFKIIKK